MSFRCLIRSDRYRTPVLSSLLLLSTAALSGCGGGQDFSNFPRSLDGDISQGYGGSLGGRYGNGQTGQAVGAERGTYPMIETSFQLANIPGDPFDYEKVSVFVTLRVPGGQTVDVPAFFDGGTTWRMRYTPSSPGTFSVASVKLNKEIAHEAKLDQKDWTVKGDTQPGFVRLDRGDHARFVFDSGARYFPLGHNQAWHTQNQPELADLFAKMHAAGENWSRVWMNHWDGKNLDWPATGKPAKLGDIDLPTAKRWDNVVDAARKNEIYFQLVLQHHGPYSSKSGYKYSGNVDPNWEDNPYNVKNGGFLETPEAFFTDPRARALTKRKLYYILARWGYSPNVLAFELFNEVENTDAAHGKLWDDIALWHREMALFLRQYDPNRHLLTTSAAPGVALDSPVWETVDYVQSHVYAPDVLTALSNLNAGGLKKKVDKPWFVGEFGSQDLKDPTGIALHEGLWASLFSGASGAAEYWDWDNVEKHDLYAQYRSAASFLTASGLAGHSGLVTASLPVETTQRSTLRFAPGGGWGEATQSEFVMGTNGIPAGIAAFPSFLQGEAHRKMSPKPLTLQVTYPEAGTFTVQVGQVSKSGGALKIGVDGKAVERAYAKGDADHAPAAADATLSVSVPAGAHTVTIENPGADWIVLRQLALSNYAPALAANARIGKDYLTAWIYNRDGLEAVPGASPIGPFTGRVTLTGLQPGHYRATWWDIAGGKQLDSTDVTVQGKEPAVLATPPVSRDIALYVNKPGAAPVAANSKGKRSGRGRNAPAAAASPSTVPPASQPGLTPLPPAGAAAPNGGPQ